MLEENQLSKLTKDIIRIRPKELTVKVKKEITEKIFDETKCVITHSLEYAVPIGAREEIIKHNMSHDFLVSRLNPRGLAKILHDDLSQILSQAERLKRRNIHLRISLIGVGLPYIGQGQYSSINEFDILSLPSLLMSMRKQYRF